MAAARGTLIWHGSHPAHPRMSARALAVRLPSAECCASQGGFPHMWGSGKPRSGLGPCSPPSPVCGPAEPPGSPPSLPLSLPSASDQGLAWRGSVPHKGWAGGAGGGRRALRPGKPGRVVGMARCPEPREQLPFYCINTCTKSCASPAQDEANGKTLSRPTAALQLTWGQREGPISRDNLPWGAPTHPGPFPLGQPEPHRGQGHETRLGRQWGGRVDS